MKTFIGIIAICFLICGANAKINHVSVRSNSVASRSPYFAYLLELVQQIESTQQCLLNSPWNQVIQSTISLFDCTNLDDAKTWSEISNGVSKHVSNFVKKAKFNAASPVQSIANQTVIEIENLTAELAEIINADFGCMDDGIKTIMALALQTSDNISKCLCSAGFPC